MECREENYHLHWQYDNLAALYFTVLMSYVYVYSRGVLLLTGCAGGASVMRL